LRCQIFPVNRLEKRMFLHLGNCDPFCRVLVEHSVEQVGRLSGNKSRHLQLLALDAVVELFDIVGVKWRYANE